MLIASQPNRAPNLRVLKASIPSASISASASISMRSRVSATA
jgi:hypothetical protein